MKRAVTLLVVFVLATGIFAVAQSASSATITGQVTDPQGAVVPNATVVAKNLATGVERSTTTTGSGTYTIPNLSPGNYDVRAEAASFSATTVRNISLLVGEHRDVNFQMIVGGTATTVEVTGQAPLIESTRSEVSTSVTDVDMARLPTLTAGTAGVSNDYAQLALTAPGVRQDTSGNTAEDLVGPGSFNYRTNLFNVDGANITDQVVSGRDVIGASLDEVQEVQVLTNNYNAEYGQAGGVIINAVTKSGSNGIHGDGHMFFRGRNLRSADPFYNIGLFTSAKPGDGQCPLRDFSGTTLVSVDGCARAPFHKKEGGFTLGGPFIKDRLFWFGSYEDTRQSVPAVLTPPTGNITIQQPVNELLWSGKIDWRVNRSNIISARYAVQRDRSLNLIVQTSNNITPDSTVNSLFNDEIFNIGLVSTITPHLVNEVRFVRHAFKSETPDNTTMPGQNHNSGFYTGADFCCPQGANQRRYQYVDNLSWTRGSHTLKMGFNISYYPYFSLFQQFHFGQYTSFDSTDTIPGEFDLGIGPGAVRTKDNVYGFYVQDSWKIRHNFTLNYGVRYDAEAGAFRGGYVAQSGNHCLQGNGLVPGCSSDYNNFQPRVGFAWEPRQGTLIHGAFAEVTELAYNNIGLDSLNFDSITLNTEIITDPTVLAAYPNFPSPAVLAPFLGAHCPTTTSGGCGRVRPISANLQNPEIRHANLGIQHQFGRSVVAEVQYVGAFSFHEFGERDINTRQILPDPAHPGFFYWGARPLFQIPGAFDKCSDGAGGVIDNCLPASQFTNIRLQENSRSAHYNGLLVSATKRLSNHIAFQAGYTWSHTLTSGEDFYGLSEPGDARNIRAEFGPAYNDIRHQANFGANFDTSQLISGNRMSKFLVNNWVFGFVGQYQSGRPYPLSTGVGEYKRGRFFGIGSETNQRPSALPDGTIVATNISSNSGANLAVGPFGAAACACPQTTFLAPLGAYTGGAADSFTGDVVDFQMPSGNLERNAAKGSGLYRTDMRITKVFHPAPQHEQLEVQLVGEFFNLFNHPNWQSFNSNDTLSVFSIGAPGCVGCIDPVTGFYMGKNGHALHIQDLQHGKVDRSLTNQNFFGLGDPATTELPRTIQLSFRVKF